MRFETLFRQVAVNKCSQRANLMVCFAAEKLKLERDFSKYNYLSLDSAVVSNLDDAANFRTVRVGISHTPPGRDQKLSRLVD